MPLLSTWTDLIGGVPLVHSALAAVVILTFIYFCGLTVYNLYFHPLRHFPGPVSHRASRIPWAIVHARGTKPFHIQRLHDRYGPVVRVSPDFLTFTDVRAWKDIYGHRIGIDANHPEMPKVKVFSPASGALNILTADREEHGRLRRALAHGFSEKALRDQEPMIKQHVDLLVERLEEHCDNGKNPLEMEKWYNWTTFDIIGDLVFAQDFGGLRNVAYDPFVQFVFDFVQQRAVTGAMRYLGLNAVLTPFSKLAGFKALESAINNVGKKLDKRMESKDDRPDLIEGLLKRQEEWNLTYRQLRSNSFILTLAGSETTATVLSGATYLLATHPEVLAKLEHEIRSKFNHADEINLSSVSSLSYLLAVLNESLRYYPPVTGGLARTVPDQGAEIAGHYVAPGTIVEVPHWAMYRSSENWTDPWTFRPERFLDMAEGKDNFEALQPFSYGPRNCIGRNLAISEMRLIVARIIYGFDLKLAPGGEDWIERQRSFAIWVKPSLPMYLTPRKS